MKEREKENKHRSMNDAYLTLRDNFQILLARLAKSDPTYTSIDLSGIFLERYHVEALWEKIKNNDVVGYIKWGSLPSNVARTVEAINEKIKNNIVNYQQYPTDFIYSILSLHVGEDIKEGEKVKFSAEEHIKYNKYLNDWEVHKVIYEKDAGNYYGAIYKNDHQRQMILAHRGTMLKPMDIIKQDSSLRADIKGVLGGKIVAQEMAAYVVTKEAIDLAKQHNYSLSFTGYGLGAWLAELSTYFSHRDFKYSQMKAVTFDSPGSVLNMENMQSNVLNLYTDLNIVNLNIVTYLSTPNFINSCNKHVGKVYRIFPEVVYSSFMESFKDFIKKIPHIKDNTFILDGLLSITGLKLKYLVDTFNPETGIPEEYHHILDWPQIKYTPKDVGPLLFKGIIECIPFSKLLPSPIINIASSALYNIVSDITLVNFITLIGEFVSGNVNQEQYWKTFKYLEANKGKNQYHVKENLNINNKFSLTYEGHYRAEIVNPQKDILSPSIGSVDWYLDKLYDNISLFTQLTNGQLEQLKKQYYIKIEDGKKYIITTSGTIDNIRDQMSRLIEVNAEVREGLIRHGFHHQITDKFANDIVLADDLPQARINYYFIRAHIFQSIENIFMEDQNVILTGLWGTGKKRVALEYAYRQKDFGKVVRWVDASSLESVEKTFRKMAEELGMKFDLTHEPDSKEIISFINSRIAKIGSGFILIFNNIEEDYHLIKNYFVNMPKTAKVIITTKNTNLDKSIAHIKIGLFTQEEAEGFLRANLEVEINKNNISENQLATIIEKTGFSPYKLTKAVQYFKESGNPKIEEFINQPIEPAEKQLLHKIIDLSKTIWDIIQYTVQLDANFINVEIYKLALSLDQDEVTHKLKLIQKYSLGEVRQNGSNVELKIDPFIYEAAISYIESQSLKNLIPKSTIHSQLLQAFDNLYPTVTNTTSPEWELAQSLHSHVLKVVGSFRNIQSLEQANLNNKIGKFYHLQSKYEIAIQNYKTALGTFEKLHKDDTISYAECLYNIGLSVQARTNYEKALEYFGRALSIWQSLYTENHAIKADILMSMSLSNFNQGEMEKAVSDAKKALGIRQLLFPKGSPKILECLKSISVICYKMGNKEEGAKYGRLEREMEQSLSSIKINTTSPIETIEKKATLAKSDQLASLSTNMLAVRNFNLNEKNDPTKVSFTKVPIGSLKRYAPAISVSDSDLPKIAAKNKGVSADKVGSSNYIDNVKSKLDNATILKKISVLAAKGYWSSKYFSKDKGIKSILTEQYFAELLGPHATTAEFNIARMLCFKAINEGIMSSARKDKDYTCAVKFSEKYPLIVKMIAHKHPTYFNCKEIVNKCKLEPEIRNKLLKKLNKNFDGSGSEEYNNTSYWYQYSREAMDEILKLRLESANVKDVQVIIPRHFWDNYSETLATTFNEIITEIKSKTLLIPLNLYGKHWIGIIIEKINEENLKIVYMDPEQKSIPAKLKVELLNLFGNEHFASGNILLQEMDVKIQQYNNCGPEIIENFLSYLTGSRTSQENSILLHSYLLELSLLNKEYAKKIDMVKALQKFFTTIEIETPEGIKAINYKSIIKNEDNTKISVGTVNDNIVSIIGTNTDLLEASEF